MKFPLLLSQVLRGVWAIAPKDALAYGPMIASWVNGAEFDDNYQKPPFGAYAVASSDSNSKFSEFDNAPEGSVAIIPVHGTMIKHDSFSSYGMTTVAEKIREAADHNNISSIIIDFDSGGGSVDSIPVLEEAISYARTKGPVIASCDYAASAALFAAVQCEEVIASNDWEAYFGSVGVMVSFADIRPYWEKQGIKFHEIYAPESTHKNLEFRNALEGDYELMEQEVLSPLAIEFQNKVKAHRKNLDLSVDGILNGRMFYAKDALKYGLVDKIGNKDFAVQRAVELANSNIKPNINSKSNTMDPKLIATLLSVIGLTALESADGHVALSEEQINNVKEAYKKKFKKELTLDGLDIKDGFHSFAESEILAIEASLNFKPKVEKEDPPAADPVPGAEGNDPTPTADQLKKMATGLKAAQEKIAALESGSKKYEEIIAALGEEPEVIKLGKQPGSDEEKNTLKNSSWNKADAARPWNIRADAQANGETIIFPVGAASTDYTQLVSDLGDFYRTRFKDEIQSFIKEQDDLRKYFPMRSNVQDQAVLVNAFLGEFSQAYQHAFTVKGTYEFQPEIVKMYDVKLDHKFTQLKEIEKNWLGYLNDNGSDAIKMPFVKYLIIETLKKLKNEQQIRRIRGVYKAPVDGVAGSANNAMNGLLKFVKVKIANNQIKIFNTGALTTDNIVDQVYANALLIPEDLRESFGLKCYMSKTWEYHFYKKLEQLYGGNLDYQREEKKLKFLNDIEIIGLPNMGSSMRLIYTFAGNIMLLEDKPGEEGVINFEQEDRTLKIWADWKESIWAVMVGKKWDVIADADYEHQMIWCNNVDEPSDYFIQMEADDTTPSVINHTSLVSVANTGATAITDIDDANIGDTVILKCGSDTNAITIAQAGNFSEMSAAWNPSAGDTITLFKRGANDWIDLARTTASSEALVIAADDATPDVAAGTEFITSANTGATAITDLDNPTLGATYTIYGGSDTDSSTIADSGNFDLTAAMTLAAGTYIKLYCRADNDYVELERG